MSEIYKVICFAIIVALTVAFFVLFFTKTNIRSNLRDYYDSAGPKLIADMLDCDFCLCFWLSVIISIFFGLILLDLTFIAIPFLATPIARFLI